MKYLDPKFKESTQDSNGDETSTEAVSETVGAEAEVGRDDASSEKDLSHTQPAEAGKTSTAPPLTSWEYAAERLLWVINLIAITGGVLICLNLLDPGPLRTVAAAILVIAGPGTGLVQLLNRFDVLVQYVFAIGVSVAISVLTAQALLSLGSIGVLEAAIPLTAIAACRPITWIIKFATRSSDSSEQAGNAEGNADDPVEGVDKKEAN